MKSGQGSYRVAIVGASSLLGKEVQDVLEERRFPVSRLTRVAGDEDEPELPILDLQAVPGAAPVEDEGDAADPDIVFITARRREPPPFLRNLAARGRSGFAVIHLARGPETAKAKVAAPSIPFLGGPPRSADARIVSAHPATIVLSTLLLRLAARFPVRSAVAQVLSPASEMGSRAIDELQKQTVNLLSFQKIPRTVFGGQLAFNILPRLGRAGRDSLGEMAAQVRRELAGFLQERVPTPALQMIQAPVFYALACSLYVETAAPVSPADASAALAGERVRVCRPAEEAPTQVGAAGSSEILVDAVSADPAHPKGLWMWAVADNIRLAAVNAVEIAESLAAGAAGSAA